MTTRSASVLDDVCGCPHVQVDLVTVEKLSLKKGKEGHPDKNICIYMHSFRYQKRRAWADQQVTTLMLPLNSQLERQWPFRNSERASPAFQKKMNTAIVFETTPRMRMILVRYLLLSHRPPKLIALSMTCESSRTWKKVWPPSAWMVYATGSWHNSCWY